MSKAQGARTFSVSLSSVKRYADKDSRGESLALKRSPGSAPRLDDRAIKLLEDLKERPFATLRDRCECVEVVSGLSVSRSTMCRAIARIGHSRQKEVIGHRARRVLEGDLEADGGRSGGAREAGFRRRVRPLGIPPSGRSMATRRGASGYGFRCRESGARTPRRSRACPSRGWDLLSGRRGSDDRPDLRGLCGEGAGA
jgi:transposase